MRAATLIAALLVASSAFAADDAPAPDDAPIESNAIALQGLNKVTGHISRIEGPLGSVLGFGTLDIIARRCWKAPPEEQPENAALLEILERKPGEPPANIFTGWMFSSSPGLSGLEHPVYDITVLACEFKKDPEKAEDSGQKTEDKKQEADKPARKTGKKK